MKKRMGLTWGCLVLAPLALTSVAVAHAPSGAIFTTLEDGSEVNFNQFPSKEAVYLDGGPGPGAPASAAGLDAGTYVFQITDPSGKRLLSTDHARCRQFTVDNDGLIDAVVAQADGCEHVTGIDMDHFALTVQMVPYSNTPNPGGVYKAWVVRVDDYLNGCEALGELDGLNVMDCGYSPGNFHGFVPAHTKTDNFKVKDVPIREIDTRFFNDRDGDGHRDELTEEWLLGLYVTWIDPLGSTNKKWSYYKPELVIIYEAHVEAVEDGIHRIMLEHQQGCTVGHIHVDGVDLANPGPQTVEVLIEKAKGKNKDVTIWIDVACIMTP